MISSSTNGNRDLPYFAINNDASMTLEKCIQTCANLGYKYAGTQNS